MSFRKYRYNIYPEAWNALEAKTFLWHEAEKIHSSQALAIDVFGTIISSPHQDIILNKIAEKMDIGCSGKWHLKLEWKDPLNLVKEKRRAQTQVDAAAWNDSHVFFFESKFTEKGGGLCNQTKPIASGKNKGIIQCNGNYELQTNPVNGVVSKCALSGKNIRYWDYIDKIFKPEIYEGEKCPFSGSWYQWMRNLTVCYAVANKKAKKPVFVLTYVDGLDYPIAQELRSNEWTHFTDLLNPNAIIVKMISYQDLLTLFTELVRRGRIEPTSLVNWVNSKITIVDTLLAHKII